MSKDWGICPDKHNHTDCPSGYDDWHKWAKKMARTHKQKRCDTCGLFAIWVPKKKV